MLYIISTPILLDFKFMSELQMRLYFFFSFGCCSFLFFLVFPVHEVEYRDVWWLSSDLFCLNLARLH